MLMCGTAVFTGNTPALLEVDGSGSGHAAAVCLFFFSFQQHHGNPAAAMGNSVTTV